MERSQWYVGVPNGVVLCVDHIKEGHPCGRLYHSYSRRAAAFSSMDEIVFRMDCLYNYLNYPYPGTNTRTFGQAWRSGDVYRPCAAPSEQQLAGTDHLDGREPDAQLPFDLGDGQADCQRGGYGRDGGRDGRRTVLVLENREAANACPGLHVLSISCKIQRKGTHSG